jgi:hypothetical protein
MSIISTPRVLAVLAAASFALPGALGTTTANADTKGGQSQHDMICDAWYNAFEFDVNQAEHADNRGNEDARDEALDAAEQDLAGAQQAGCEWALRKLPPTGNGTPRGKAYAGP